MAEVDHPRKNVDMEHSEGYSTVHYIVLFSRIMLKAKRKIEQNLFLGPTSASQF
jgi:hypothetical protein